MEVNAKGSPTGGEAGVKLNHEYKKRKVGADTFKSNGIHMKPHLKTKVSAYICYLE